jgi:beta-alanine degradation protein BauB
MRMPVMVLLLLGVGAASAQDAAVANADTIRVTLDNERVRVLEAVIPPGTKEKLHSHPQSIVHVVEGGKMRNHFPDGSTSDGVLVAGTSVWREALTHWAENTGDTTVRVVIVEFKAAPASSR